MKILYVLNSTNAEGGATRSFDNLLNELLVRGNDALVVMPDTGGYYKVLKGKGVSIYATPYESDIIPYLRTTRDKILFLPRLIRNKCHNYIAVKKIVKICEEFEPDLIHTNVSPISIGYLVSKKLGIPHIYHVREYGDKDFDLKIIKIKQRLADSYTISITKDISKYRNLNDESKDCVIYNGIYPLSSIRKKFPKERYLFYAGRLTVKKGFGFMMDAYIDYAKSAGNHLRMIVAGGQSGMESHELCNSIRDRLEYEGLSESVDWLGVIDNVDEYMLDSVATVVPSVCEGFGRVVAEAMFNGSLVIGRDSGGIKEQFDNGVHVAGDEIGLRFNTKEELIAHFMRLTEDASFIEPYIDRSQECVKKLYSNDNNAKSILSFYEKILQGRAIG